MIIVWFLPIAKLFGAEIHIAEFFPSEALSSSK
jgi:hypothetical protein